MARTRIRWRRSAQAAAVCTAAIVLGGGCLDDFHTPSAYDSEVYLCNSDADLAARIASCEQQFETDNSCGGVISFQGTLEGHPVTVTATLAATVFQTVDSGTVELLSAVTASGTSPYFAFTLLLTSVGGRNDIVDNNGRFLTFDSEAETLPDPLNDERVNVGLRLSSGGDSAELEGVTGNGNVVVSLQAPNLLRAKFSGSFGASADKVVGCFEVLAQHKRLLLPGT